MLTNSDLVELTDFRRHLHRHPELSGQERWTAGEIEAALRDLSPDRIETGLGGHGVAGVFVGADPGPTLMFRAELDALPIDELSSANHRSAIAGVGHLCGHDGHSTILLGLARLIARRRPARGRVVLLFQPAEEDGSGAAAVLSDPRFGSLAPDWAFALHNMPGVALGRAAVKSGPANCASQGVKITLTGKTSHASVPERGISPALALAHLIPKAIATGGGGAVVPGYRLVTVTHARMGEPAFGISPGEAELWLTLRTLLDEDMTALETEVDELVRTTAQDHGLSCAVSRHDVFRACTNNPEATRIFQNALDSLGITRGEDALPMRASEDFGRFGENASAAMMLLGAGTDHPMLHNPDYDFPDALIAPGVAIFEQVLRDMLGG